MSEWLFFVALGLAVVLGSGLTIFGPVLWRNVVTTYRRWRTPVVPLEADPRYIAARYKADHYDVLQQHVDETIAQMTATRETFLDSKDPLLSEDAYDAYLQALKDVAEEFIYAPPPTTPVGPPLRDTLHP